MAMTFDATLKEMGRECPEGFLAAFDRPPASAVSVLNVELSTVTASADVVYGLGEPLEEIIHIDCQSSAAAWKRADLLLYNAILFARHHVPVHTVVVLLRPQAAHSHMNGSVNYTARPGRGKMEFGYEVVRLWKRPVAELLAAECGVLPLAVLGMLPASTSVDESLADEVQRLVERLTNEVPPERAKRLLTEALLLTGLRVKRDLAVKIFRGVRMMQESDTYLMILEEGEEKGRARASREAILAVGEERLGPPDQSVRIDVGNVTDLERLNRLVRCAARAANWREILDTP